MNFAFSYVVAEYRASVLNVFFSFGFVMMVFGFMNCYFVCVLFGLFG